MNGRDHPEKFALFCCQDDANHGRFWCDRVPMCTYTKVFVKIKAKQVQQQRD